MILKKKYCYAIEADQSQLAAEGPSLGLRYYTASSTGSKLSACLHVCCFKVLHVFCVFTASYKLEAHGWKMVACLHAASRCGKACQPVAILSAQTNPPWLESFPGLLQRWAAACCAWIRCRPQGRHALLVQHSPAGCNLHSTHSMTCKRMSGRTRSVDKRTHNFCNLHSMLMV